MKLEYYVYVYLDPTKPSVIYDGVEFRGEPFYVGKGKNNRKAYHLQCYNKDKDRFVIKKIKKMLVDGIHPVVMIFKENLTETDAFFYEKYLIQKIGRRNIGLGTLCNLTNGGEGVSGKIWTEEDRHKMSVTMRMSESWKRFFISDKYKENLKKVSVMAKALKSIPYEQRYGVTEAQKIKTSISKNHADISGENNPMFGQVHSSTTKEKISTRLRGNPNLGGRLGKTFSSFDFFQNGVLLKSVKGQKNAKAFCIENGLSFQVLCKGKSVWRTWSCKRNKKYE